MFVITERRARLCSLRLNTIEFLQFFFSCVKSTKLKLLLQAHLPFVEEPAYRFRRAMLVRDTAATYCSYDWSHGVGVHVLVMASHQKARSSKSCCRCNKNGSCQSCACAKASTPCVNCCPGKLGRCTNRVTGTLHHPAAATTNFGANSTTTTILPPLALTLTRPMDLRSQLPFSQIPQTRWLPSRSPLSGQALL